MPKITRATGNIKAFASEQLTNERTLFGQTTIANDLPSQYTPQYLRGWGVVGPSDAPSLQDFNAAMYTATQTLAYLFQMGIPEYSAGQEYFVGSFSTSAGILYRSLVDNNVSNNPASSPGQWQAYVIPGQATMTTAGITAYANQTESVDGVISNKAATPLGVRQYTSANFYTATEMDSKLVLKADVATTYTKAQVDALTQESTETTRGTILVATQTQVDNGTAVNRAVTPAKMRFGFNRVFGTSGYILFPTWLGGFLIQWGVIPAGVSNQAFPVAFSTAPLNIQLTPDYNSTSTSGGVHYYVSLAVSGFTRSPTYTDQMRYLVWGY